MQRTASFSYSALRRDGSIGRGVLHASSDADAKSVLERMGLLPMDVRALSTRGDANRSLPPRDLAVGLRVISELLEAGLPIARALSTFAELAPPTWQYALPAIRQAVREGKSLGGALREAPVDVPPVITGMIAAGEDAGNVAGATRRAADIAESSAETHDAIRNALAYPALLGIAGAGTIALMVGVVIPRFASILAELGEKLPPLTRFLLDSSAAARAAAIPVLIGLAVGIVAIRAWMSTVEGRRSIHAALLRVPLVGSVREALASARIAVTVSAMLESAVPIRNALSFAAITTGDGEIESRLRAAAVRVESGESIAAACRVEQALTPLTLRLVQAGEESGRLTGMLRHAAKLEQSRADRTTRVAVRLLEPILILLFAGVVAFVAAAMLQAVYSIRPTP